MDSGEDVGILSECDMVVVLEEEEKREEEEEGGGGRRRRRRRVKSGVESTRMEEKKWKFDNRYQVASPRGLVLTLVLVQLDSRLSSLLEQFVIIVTGKLNSKARHGTARHGTARHGTARHGTARHGTMRTDLTRPLRFTSSGTDLTFTARVVYVLYTYMSSYCTNNSTYCTNNSTPRNSRSRAAPVWNKLLHIQRGCRG
jgi:hypothetical protein